MPCLRMPDFPSNALRTQFTFCETCLLGRLGLGPRPTQTVLNPGYNTCSPFHDTKSPNHNLAVQRKSFLSLDILLWAYDDEDY